MVVAWGCRMAGGGVTMGVLFFSGCSLLLWEGEKLLEIVMIAQKCEQTLGFTWRTYRKPQSCELKISQNWSWWHLDETAFPRQLIRLETFDDDTTLQIVSSVCDLDNRTLDKKCLRVLPPTSSCYSNVISIGFQSVYFPSDVRHYTQERSFLAMRDEKPLKLKTWLLIRDVFRERSWIKGGNVGINSMWTKNFEMYKLDFKKAEEPGSNCQLPLDHRKSKKSQEKHLLLLHWLHQSLWLCGSQ